jgi:serine/threonine-protein kinase
VSEAPITAETIVDGRYRVVSRIGSGGMADVYCAEDLQLGRNVALKLLHDRFAADGEFVERFRREASSAAGLQHPNVVAVYDRGEWDGTSYIAMEHVRGRTLKQLVTEEAPLDPGRAIGLVEQILRAARFAHRRGIIHRDLKPHNVIVDDEDRAKVTDFGIARAGASDMTQTGSIMGTAQYLSPEQAQGAPVDARSDLYSIGITLYELLTGRVPFDGDSAVTIALKQVNEAPVPPSAYNEAVTPELDAVVLKALAKDPADRFPDADAFTAALEDARRAPQATAVTALAPADWDPTHAAPPAPTGPFPAVVEDPEPDRSRWWLWVLGILLVVALIAGVLLLTSKDQKLVPSVVGADQASAETTLRAAGFQVDSVTRTSSKTKGIVLGQDPPGGEKADEGSTVTLTVSDGPESRAVPTVEGLTYKSAAARLREAGFKVRRTNEPSDTVKAGRVVSANPGQGSQAKVGDTVELTVSTGPQEVALPSVVGQSEDNARATLDKAGFAVGTITRKESSDQDPGTVLSQSPAPGTQAAKGSAVDLAVAKAPTQVDVPDITGETQDVATQRLSGAGFEVVTKQRVVDSEEGDGVVLDQDPSGGKADKGSRVTITIGKFEAGSPEPGTGTTGGTGTTTGPTTTDGGTGTTP